MDQQKTYLYNAHGHGVSGQIVRPFQQTIEVQAGMSLPTTGGYGAARVEDFRFKEIVSFESAATQVSGSLNEKDKTHTTLVSVTIENLNILNVVTAERVVARLAAHQGARDEEPHIVLIGSHFVNLRIAGCETTVEFGHPGFWRLDTFEALRNEIESGRPQESPKPQGVVLCTFGPEVKTRCPGVEQRGNVLVVPQFGTIYIGEVIAQDSRRTLTMLRLELGSPTAGTTTVAQVQGNGQPYPPTPSGGSGGTN